MQGVITAASLLVSVKCLIRNKGVARRLAPRAEIARFRATLINQTRRGSATPKLTAAGTLRFDGSCQDMCQTPPWPGIVKMHDSGPGVARRVVPWAVVARLFTVLDKEPPSRVFT